MTAKPTFFATEAEFRRWLEANHDKADELLVGFWKKGTGKIADSAAGRKIAGYDIGRKK